MPARCLRRVAYRLHKYVSALGLTTFQTLTGSLRQGITPAPLVTESLFWVKQAVNAFVVNIL